MSKKKLTNTNTNTNIKKNKQLGMTQGKAGNILRRNLIFYLSQKIGEVCYRCSKPMTKENYSIDHKDPWLDSDDPVGLFFDMDNIAFSHRACNIANARKPYKIIRSPEFERARNRERYHKLKRENPELLKKRSREKYLKRKARGLTQRRSDVKISSSVV